MKKGRFSEDQIIGILKIATVAPTKSAATRATIGFLSELFFR